MRNQQMQLKPNLNLRREDKLVRLIEPILKASTAHQSWDPAKSSNKAKQTG
jgi:hypothetical protein